MHYGKQTSMNVFFCVLKRCRQDKYFFFYNSVKFILIRKSYFSTKNANTVELGYVDYFKP